MKGQGVCQDCGGSRTQHLIDPDGCECARCLNRPGARCQAFIAPPVVEKRKGKRPAALTAPTDTDTQKAGAAHALPRTGTRRREAYDAIDKAGLRGVTFDELVATTGRTYSQIGPRVRELVRDSHVRKAQSTRPGVSGAQQDVWVSSAQFAPRQDPIPELLGAT